jgi:hypothetical protein
MSIPLLGFVTFVAVVVSIVVALQLGRIGGSFGGEFGRQNVGSGYAYLLVNLAGISALVAIASLPLPKLSDWRTRFILTGSFVAFAAIHSLVLGGRAEIIIVTIAILVVTTARLGRPLKPVLVVMLLCATLTLGVYRVTTRETFGTRDGKSKLSLAAESLQDPLALVTRYDVSAYDKLVLLEEVGPDLRYGETYVAALLSPLPGTEALAPEGGNQQFTEQFIPKRYQRGVTYEGISMFGESRFNFGWLGVPASGALAGYAYGLSIRRARTDRRCLLILSMSAGVFPSLIRADALNTAALGASLTVFTLVISAFVTRHRASVHQRQYTRVPSDGAFDRAPAP